MTTELSMVRKLWACFETIHDVIYFSPLVRECEAQLGLKGFWMTYFAFRVAPLGELGPDATTALFYNFHPRRVRRALPDAWAAVTAAQALAAREDVAARALRDAVGPHADVHAAAEFLWAAAQAADTAGRPLAAANKALPRPDDPIAALWQASTVLREHRGEGHNAVLLTRRVDGAAAHLVKAGAGESDPEVQQAGRGFAAEEWEAAHERLRERGWLGRDGSLTAAGERAHDDIEDATDEVAAEPWRHVGARAAEATLRALLPIATAVAHTGIIPTPSPVGLVRPAGW